MTITKSLKAGMGRLRPRPRRAVAAGAAAAITLVALSALAASAQGASKQNVLKWALGSSPRTLFGPTDFSTEGASVMSLVNQGLLALSPTNQLVPTLASSWKAVSPTKYVYTIRKGVKFSDGRPLTAADVVYSINLHKSKKVASEESTFFTNVKSVRASGKTVTVTLKKPDSIWKYMPAHEAGYVYEARSVRAHLADYGTPAALPIGTGPYKVSEFVPNSHITLVRNPYYWGKKPYYDKIVFSIIPDPQTLFLAMQSGQVDGTFDVPGAQLGTWKASPAMSITSFAADGFHGLTLDMKEAPFNDLHVRRAISYAVDRGGIINAVFGGAAKIANTLDDPSMLRGALSQREINKGYAAIPTYNYDLAKAKAELSQSSVPNGFTTTMNVPQDSATSVSISQAIQASLKKIGITLNLKMMPGGPRFDIILQHGPNLGMQIIGNVADVPDPVELPWLYFKSDQAAKGGNNSSNYMDAKTDGLITQAQTTTDRVAAARAAIKAQTRAAQAAAMVPIEWFTWHAATRKGLKLRNPGAFYYNTVWVNQLSREG